MELATLISEDLLVLRLALIEDLLVLIFCSCLRCQNSEPKPARP